MALAVACAGEEERPGPPPQCTDPACLEFQTGANTVGVGSGVAGSAGTGGDGGAGGGPGMPSASLVLAGNVRQITAIDPVQTASISGFLDVRAESATTDADPVSTETDAGGGYRLEGVRQATPVWVGVGAFEDGPDDLYMDTLQAVAPEQSSDDLVVAPRSLMADLVSTSFTVNPIELDPSAAHVVVRFVDDSDVPLSGVAVIYPPSTLASVAYDSGDGLYLDSFDETDERGVAVIVNVPAAPYPGVTLTLLAELNDVTHDVAVTIASDSVSVVTAVITDP